MTLMVEVGVISDTHSLLRPAALKALRGCDRIVHAGDIGSPEVITGLSTIAPVTAIRGNIDKGDWASEYPEEEVLEVHGRYIYIIHNVHDLDLDPIAAGSEVVVSGHSHQPKIESVDGVLYVNPGSAGPRRFSLPIAVARLCVGPEGVDAKVIELPA